MKRIMQLFEKLKQNIVHHKRRWIIGAVVVVVLLLVVTMLFRPSSKQVNLQTAVLKRGDLSSTIGATGTVRSGQTLTMFWKTSGEVGTVAVKVGDKVTKDEELASLLTSSLPQNVILAQSDLVTAKENLDNVKNSNLASAQAQQALANAQKALTSAQDNVTSMDWVRGTSDQIDSANANLVLAKQALQDAQNFFDKFSKVDPGNPEYAQAYSQLAAAQQKKDSAQANLDYLQGHYNVTEASISAANLAVAQAQFDDAKRQWDRLKDGPDSADVAAAQAKMDSAQALLDEAHLTAPFDGMVTEVSSSVGDQVSLGTKALRIDNFAQFLVDVDISEMDIHLIKVDQDVVVTFDAIPGKTYTGKVVTVSKAGEVSQNVTNFTVTVELTNPDSDVLPGMTASVNIVAQKFANVLLVPNRAVRTVNGKQVIYLLRSGQPVAVAITLGATSDTYSELASGDVKEGDLVVLNPSSVTTTSSLFGSGSNSSGGGFTGGTSATGPGN
ncbi:MAG: efflux RND transporter periplasmic adaptor subunit [Anaerolineaceae bacterium]